MKISPPSGDMLIKMVIAAGVVGALIYAGRKASNAASSAFDAVSDVLTNVGTAINPADPGNLAYTGVNAVGGAVTSSDGPGRNADGSWTLGGWVYDVLHGDQVGMLLTGKPKF